MGGKVKVRFNCIVEYINEKLLSNFTGSVKLSFENGDIVAVNEANKHDLPTTKNTKGNDLVAEYLNLATKHDFNGAVVFVYDSGRVTDYSYSRTYKGETLKNFLGA